MKRNKGQNNTIPFPFLRCQGNEEWVVGGSCSFSLCPLFNSRFTLSFFIRSIEIEQSTKEKGRTNQSQHYSLSPLLLVVYWWCGFINGSFTMERSESVKRTKGTKGTTHHVLSFISLWFNSRFHSTLFHFIVIEPSERKERGVWEERTELLRLVSDSCTGFVLCFVFLCN